MYHRILDLSRLPTKSNLHSPSSSNIMMRSATFIGVSLGWQSSQSWPFLMGPLFCGRMSLGKHPKLSMLDTYLNAKYHSYYISFHFLPFKHSMTTYIPPWKMPRSKATTSTRPTIIYSPHSPCSPNELSHFSRVSQLFPLWACLGCGCSQINIHRSKVGRFGISEGLFFLQLIGSDSKVLTPIDANWRFQSAKTPSTRFNSKTFSATDRSTSTMPKNFRQPEVTRLREAFQQASEVAKGGGNDCRCLGCIKHPKLMG